jgi:NUMOD4 motif|nr:MAG TPA: HNH endonuclease [Caudoviricetes sp.]
MTEEWFNAPAAYEGYQVSTRGRIRHGGTQQIKKLTYDHRGTPRVNLFCDGQSSSCRAHHVVWYTFFGAIPYKHYVVPKDGDWENIAPDNLECISIREYRQKQWAEYNDAMDRIFAEVEEELG